MHSDLYGDALTWEKVDVDCPSQSKSVFTLFFFYANECLRLGIVVLLLSFLFLEYDIDDFTVIYFTFTYILFYHGRLAVDMIVASLSWCSWTYFVSMEGSYVSLKLTCGNCGRNA